MLDERHVSRAAICGVSFGGTRRAAVRRATSPSADVGAGAGVDARTACICDGGTKSTRACRGCSVRVFLAEAPLAPAPEIDGRVARPAGAARLHAAAVAHARCARRCRSRGWRRGPADRASSIAAADCARDRVPTLIVHGEPRLDHVVPVERHGRLRSADSRARAPSCSNAPGISDRSRSRTRSRRSCGHFSSRASRQPDSVLREIAGPGRPPRGAARRTGAGGVSPTAGRGRPAASARRSCSRIRTRSTAARCTPKRCIRRRRRWRASAARCCASTSAASARARARSTKATGEKDDFRAALDFMARALSGRAAVGGGHVVRRLDCARRSAPTIRASSTLHRHRAAGLDRYDFARVAREHEAEVLHPGRARRDLPARRTCASSTRAPPSRRSSW